MKITGGFNDATHWSNYFATCPIVWLDGASIDHVCEADDVAGYIIVEVQGDDGKPKVDASGKNIETKRLTGKVEFIGARLERTS